MDLNSDSDIIVDLAREVFCFCCLFVFLSFASEILIT